MARYDRELLVDYLENIYVLYVADHKIQKKYEQIQEQVFKKETGVRNPVPKMSEKEPVITFTRFCWLVVGVPLLCLFFYIAFTVSGHGFFDKIAMYIIGFFSLIIGGPCTILAVKEIWEAVSYNRYRITSYEKDIKTYEANKIKNEQLKKTVPALRKKMGQYSAEHQRITGLINQLYSVNVIPNQYRNVYAVIYLYDYFSGSREDDLAMALNTFVLEEIKSRLDVIIANQGEMLLNQYRMIGNQERALEEQRAHAKRMEEKVDRLNISSDERNQYLSMIASSAASTEYLITRNYIFNG